MDALASLVDGDARAALNGLQMAVESRLAAAGIQSGCPPGSDGGIPVMISTEDVKEGLQQSHVLYDRKGESQGFHYYMCSRETSGFTLLLT